MKRDFRILFYSLNLVSHVLKIMFPGSGTEFKDHVTSLVVVTHEAL